MSVRFQITIRTTLLLCGGGCKLWRDETPDTPLLPRARMSRDAIVLEITFARMMPDEAARSDDLWSQVDEQAIAGDARRRLGSNGIRAGVVGMQLPAALRKALTATPDNAAAVQEAAHEESSLQARARRLQCRAGRRHEVVASKTHKSLNVLVRDDKGAVEGSTLADAQCLFAVKSFPLGDGRVRLILTPEVHFGRPRSQWSGADGVLRQVVGRDRKVFDRLRIEVVLSPGQTLVLSTTDSPTGLGGNFFTEASDGRDLRKFLLLRLAQTQYDDRLAPDRVVKPLATILE